MSEEVGKALQSVAERVNQAAARRPKVTAAREAPLRSTAAVAPLSGSEKVVLRQHDSLCKAAKHLNLWMGDSRARGSTFITPCMFY